MVLAVARIPDRLAAASRAVLNGLWLGTLSDAALQALDERYYEREAVYRTAAWNEAGLFPWERGMIEDHFGDGGRVVVVGCGGGRQVLALLEAGFDATGYETHAALAAHAADFLAAHGHRGRARPIDRDTFPPVDCDGAVLGWGTFSLVHGRRRRQALLAAARARLPAGGPLLLSFFARARDSRELRWTAAAANALLSVLRRPPVDLGDTLAPNLVHVFSRSELERDARDAGFELLDYGVIGEAAPNTTYAAATLRAA